MEFIFDNWKTILTGLVAVFGFFKWLKAIPYANFAKEVGDVYIKYQEFRPDGFTDEEYKLLGKEVVEAVESGKIAF